MPDRIAPEPSRAGNRLKAHPITGKTIRASLKARLRAANDTSGGIRLNSKLDRRLREEAAPRIYQ